MQPTDHFNQAFIEVVPLYDTTPNVTDTIDIYRLCFWYDNSFDHPVNDTTLRFFLFYAGLYGAYCYPDFPQMGCFAINANIPYAQGEVKVAQIRYKKEVIYCIS